MKINHDENNGYIKESVPDIFYKLIPMIQHYSDKVKEFLSDEAKSTKSMNKLNYLNQARMAENFYANILNILFGLELKNLNTSDPDDIISNNESKSGKNNCPVIDLGDIKNKVAFQITSETGMKKIRKTLNDATKEGSNVFNTFNKIYILRIDFCKKLSEEDKNKLSSDYKLNPRKFEVWDLSIINSYIEGLLSRATTKNTKRNLTRLRDLFLFVKTWREGSDPLTPSEYTYDKIRKVFEILFKKKKWSFYWEKLREKDTIFFNTELFGVIEEAANILDDELLPMCMWEITKYRIAVDSLKTILKDFMEQKKYLEENDEGFYLPEFCRLDVIASTLNSNYNITEEDKKKYLDVTVYELQQKYKHIKYFFKALFYELTGILDLINDRIFEKKYELPQLNNIRTSQKDENDGFEYHFVFPYQGYNREDIENYVMKCVNPVSYYLSCIHNKQRKALKIGYCRNRPFLETFCKLDSSKFFGKYDPPQKSSKDIAIMKAMANSLDHILKNEGKRLILNPDPRKERYNNGFYSPLSLEIEAWKKCSYCIIEQHLIPGQSATCMNCPNSSGCTRKQWIYSTS